MSSSLPPFPDGWFCVGLSRELPINGVLTRQFMGQEVVLFRTRSGRPVAVDAYCPHLGAHLGHGGTVHGEVIRCPFHHFDFDPEGICVATGYGTRPPPKANLRSWEIHETGGLLLLYHDAADRKPAWRVPDREWEDWSPLLARTFRLRSHPQETSENSVDLGHLTVVHGYNRVTPLAEPFVDGPYLRTCYAIERPSGPIRSLQVEFTAHVHGLGYSLVEVTVKKLGIQTRQLVLPTPVDGEFIDLRIGLSLKKKKATAGLHPLLKLLPGVLYQSVAAKLIFAGYAHDVAQDFPIWEHKTYISPPALAEGDGPVGPYRYWVRQFYPEAST